MGDEAGAGRFSVLLRAARVAAALTQEELANRAGLSTKAVGALERGERTRPHPHTVRALVDALDLDGSDRARMVRAVDRSRSTDGDTGGVRAGHGPTPLPAPPGPLIGREEVVTGVVTLVTSGTRVLTLTGPGGVGKTRLALAVAEALGDRFGDPVLVDLASVREPPVVVDQIAVALGLAPSGAVRGPSAVAGALGDRSLLLVLDNLEQVIECAPDLAALAAGAPGLVMLITSRTPLRIRAEREVVVQPLAVPSTDDDGAETPAVALFLDRCAAAGAPVVLDSATAPAVAAICRRLAGLPLAIELAAAGSRMLSLMELLQQLDTVVADAAVRDLPERQQTMASVIEWSLALVEDDDRQLFVRLAVLAGSFTMESAAAVAGVDDVRSPLARLVDASLVVRGRDVAGRARFRMLEPVRQEALRRLRSAGGEPAAARRHAAWFHSWSVTASARLRGADLVPCLDELAASHADVRAAALWLVEAGHWEEVAELLHAVWLYAALRGHGHEVLDWCMMVTASGPDGLVEARTRLATAGVLHALGDVPGVRAAATTARVAAARAGARDLAAEAGYLTAMSAAFAGDLTTASAALARAVDDNDATSNAWTRAHLEIAHGMLALLQQDLSRAVIHLDAGERLGRRDGDDFTLCTLLNVRATLTEVVGDHEESLALLSESVQRAVAGELGWPLAYSLPALAAVALEVDEVETAAMLFGAAAAVKVAASVDPTFPTTRSLTEGALDGVRAQLDEQDLAAAWAAGRALPRPALVDVARELSARGRG